MSTQVLPKSPQHAFENAQVHRRLRQRFWSWLVVVDVVAIINHDLNVIQIPGGSNKAIAAAFQEANASQTVSPQVNRVCGRYFGTQASEASKTVCSKI